MILLAVVIEIAAVLASQRDRERHTLIEKEREGHTPRRTERSEKGDSCAREFWAKKMTATFGLFINHVLLVNTILHPKSCPTNVAKTETVKPNLSPNAATIPDTIVQLNWSNLPN